MPNLLYAMHLHRIVEVVFNVSYLGRAWYHNYHYFLPAPFFGGVGGGGGGGGGRGGGIGHSMVICQFDEAMFNLIQLKCLTFPG